MLVGAIAAIAHGASFPLLWLFLGDFFNVFISQAITSRFFSEFIGLNPNATDINCATMFDFNGTNLSISEFIRLNSSNQISCLIGDAFINEINSVTYAFVGIGLAAFVVAYVQIAAFQTAAERQVYKIRLKYYRAVLRQNIAWFDANPTGEVATRLSE